MSNHFTFTSTSSAKEPLTIDKLSETIDSLRDLPVNVRKLRYLTLELSSMRPIISRTRSYEMVIVHPAALSDFLSQFEMSGNQLSLPVLTPATDGEWMEWCMELSVEMKERMEWSEK